MTFGVGQVGGAWLKQPHGENWGGVPGLTMSTSSPPLVKTMAARQQAVLGINIYIYITTALLTPLATSVVLHPFENADLDL